MREQGNPSSHLLFSPSDFTYASQKNHLSYQETVRSSFETAFDLAALVWTAIMATNYSEAEVRKAHEILFNEGLKMRYQVAGKEYVDRSLQNGSGPFASAMQEVR